MQISRAGLEFIKLHEGFRSEAYGDPVGILTIGYGSTNRSQSFVKWWATFKSGRMSRGSRISQSEASDALEYTMKHEFGAAVNIFLGDKKVPQYVFDAMCSVVYNCGPGALKWKWAAAAKKGDYRLAAQLLTKTATTAKDPRTGRRRTLPGLVRRRVEEGILLHYGVYTGIKSKDLEKLAPKPEPKPLDVAKPDIKPEPKPRKSLLASIIEMLMKLFPRRK